MRRRAGFRRRCTLPGRLALGVHENAASAMLEVGGPIHVHVAVALVVLEHGHARLLRDPADEPPRRRAWITRSMRPASRSRRPTACAVRRRRAAWTASPGRPHGAALPAGCDQGGVGVEGLAATAEQQGVAALDAQAGGVDGDVGPGLVDSGGAQRRQAAGPRPGRPPRRLAGRSGRAAIARSPWATPARRAGVRRKRSSRAGPRPSDEASARSRAIGLRGRRRHSLPGLWRRNNSQRSLAAPVARARAGVAARARWASAVQTAARSRAASTERVADMLHFTFVDRAPTVDRENANHRVRPVFHGARPRGPRCHQESPRACYGSGRLLLVEGIAQRGRSVLLAQFKVHAPGVPLRTGEHEVPG